MDNEIAQTAFFGKSFEDALASASDPKTARYIWREYGKMLAAQGNVAQAERALAMSAKLGTPTTEEIR